VLTRSGLGAVLSGIVLGVLGVWWGYEELVIVATAIGMIMLLAIWVSQRPSRAVVTRRILAVRVARGDPIPVSYRLHNPTRFRSGRATIIDRCDNNEIRVEAEAVPAHSARVIESRIPTKRRGLFDVGPIEIERIDALWLTVGTRRTGQVSPVVVHPKVYDLLGPQGAVRAVENESVIRRASSDPLSGFVSMREYVPGDDPRLIHWPTTARVGTLMIREHVDVRRPEFTVVLDTAPEASAPDDFEEMVDVAASLAVHAIRSGLDVMVRTTDRNHAGRPTPLAADSMVLELLTQVQRSADEDLLSLATLFTGGFDHTSVVMVTGPTGPSSRFPTTERLTTVRIGEGASLGPGIALAAHRAPEFVSRWRSTM
jgi:uncharacterized protein (DUF58 family)